MTALAQLVLDFALTFLGVPYVFGGTDPTGFDCSGYTQFTYGHYGIYLPRLSVDQGHFGLVVPTMTLARPADIVYYDHPFTTVDHVGIYLGSGYMAVAPHTGDVVKIEAVYPGWTDFRRVLPDGAWAGMPATGTYVGDGIGYTPGSPVVETPSDCPAGWTAQVRPDGSVVCMILPCGGAEPAPPESILAAAGLGRRRFAAYGPRSHGH